MRVRRGSLEDMASAAATGKRAKPEEASGLLGDRLYSAGHPEKTDRR